MRLPLEAAAPLLREKLGVYVSLFGCMDNNDGWLRYPEKVVEFFHQLGVKHWAELYSQEGKTKWIKSHGAPLAEAIKTIAEALGPNPDADSAIKLITETIADFTEAISSEDDEALSDLELLDPDLSKTDLSALSEAELQEHRDKWVIYLVHLYDDLSWATHGESIHSLVSKAIDSHDDDALVKAIQIDRSLITYFHDRFSERSMRGDSDFFDSLAYRVKNPPKRGVNKYPLLWILFKDLNTMYCLHRGVTSKQVLDFYQSVVGDHPKFRIDDEIIVQRQRRKFNKLYSHPK